ncbi:stage II sporulation protein D [Pullulanibacillus camelliae]|uniref:Stage II sporulation protein D n=2 Tax=Pullulanibacillus camelliae TaxID=1707096 RepID=A0A8J2VJY8_9BACL|nr:stage II sporulation protein D [Pullulanibacillus camelliae]
MKRPLVIVLSIFLFIVLVIPTLIVMPFSHSSKTVVVADQQKKAEAAASAKSKDPAVTVSVYRTTEKKVEAPSLRDYLVGVVASEMPAEFNEEALKAQALSARTFIVKRLVNKQKATDQAVVTDTPDYQVFKDKSELKKIWGKDYNWKLKKIEEAVDGTAGQIITYNGTPITASFFSTSNGYTENAEDYWENTIPYLKSVKSPWDVDSPKYKDTIKLPVATVEKKLQIKLPTTNGDVGSNIKRTPGHRIASIKIGNKTWTGREIREKLNLRSSDFTMVRNGQTLSITTKGYGHGVGMSQYGANGMANAGKNYQDIVKYYYKGVKITNADDMLNKMLVKK